MQLICGIWHLDGRPAERHMLEAMCRAMQSPVHPGTEACWLDGPVGMAVLGFHEAATIHSPHPSGRVTVADVRLDDPAAAAARYGEPAAHLLAGVDLLSEAVHLPGDYAAAQWRPREQLLSLTRDALGVRPLCYCYLPGRAVVFASFPAGIFASGLLPREVDRQQLARELFGSPATRATLFTGIRNVPPGASVVLSSAEERTEQYWRAEPREPLRGTREAAAEELRTLLTAAVGSCLPPAGDVAAHLSGGLDSSAIAVLASRRLQPAERHLLAYSFLSETWPGLPIAGERPYVDAVLRQEPDIRWQAVEAVFSPEWPHDRWNPDAPLVLSDGSPENIVCVDAAARGAAVVLSGWGGDEGITFNGRGALAAGFRQGRWLWLHRQLRSMRHERGFSLRAMLLGDVLGPQLSPMARQRLRRGKRPGSGSQTAMAQFLAPELAALAAEAAPIYTSANPAVVQAGLLRDGHLSFRAGRFAAIGARYGLAFRFPLLNRRVVEFALSMPPAWHVHAGWKRRLFREAMEGVLPPEVQWRHSKFRSLPAVPYHLTRYRERLLQRVEQLAGNPQVAGLFRMEQVAAVLRALPPPDAVSDPGTHPALQPLPLVAQLLDYASFLEAHFATTRVPAAHELHRAAI